MRGYNPILLGCPKCGKRNEAKIIVIGYIQKCEQCGNVEYYNNEEKMKDNLLEDRILCPDESCTGTLGSDGKCRVCGAKPTGFGVSNDGKQQVVITPPKVVDDFSYLCFECDEEFKKDDYRLGDELFCPLCGDRLQKSNYSPFTQSTSFENNRRGKSESKKHRGYITPGRLECPKCGVKNKIEKIAIGYIQKCHKCGNVKYYDGKKMNDISEGNRISCPDKNCPGTLDNSGFCELCGMYATDHKSKSDSQSPTESLPLKNVESSILDEKKCPFCAEKIKADAIKCKHCGEWLRKEPIDRSDGKIKSKGQQNHSITYEITDKPSEEVISVTYKLGTKWLKFWNYFSLPVGGVFGIVMSIGIPVTAIILLPISLFQFAVAYGLHNRRLWGWKLNWVIIALTLISISVPPQASEPIASPEEWIGLFLIKMIMGALIWIWPNYVYWKKRRPLFSYY